MQAMRAKIRIGASADTPADNSSLQDDALDTSKPGSSLAASPDADAEAEAEAEADAEVETVPEPAPVVKRKRGRPPRNPAAVVATPTKESTPADDSEPGGGPSTPIATPSTIKKRRGRPPVRGSVKSRGGPSHVTAVPLDKDGNPQEVENDEIVLPPDPAGESKVDINGNLKGGREYRCRTFTIKGRGERLYMLSTEPARCIGFRDSYLFFQKHKQLFKIIMDDEENYKGRAIGVVTARSVFREFGARIIVGGRRIIDDYWETREREAGAIEGELADPDDKIPPGGLKEYNRNQYVAWHGASSVYHTGQPSVPLQMQSERHQGRMRDKMLGLAGLSGASRKQTVITDENWMLEHAKAASMYNGELLADRAKAVAEGVYEPHTNLMFWPSGTQPTRARWERIVGETVEDGTGAGTGTSVGTKKLPRLPAGMCSVTQAIRTPAAVLPAYPYLNGPYGGQGMKDVSEEMLEVLRTEFGDDMVSRVREQAAREREWEKGWRRGVETGLAMH
ncbi:chromatin remodelling complex Rsc7/Swp82 subunit-domain-containing protein [Kalaharituber pfeilii]|nr:chromatin remodelling complex Rsc7/Swp82 subunit-domain-containing protein [Kalaharituber pfeilii]